MSNMPTFTAGATSPMPAKAFSPTLRQRLLSTSGKSLFSGALDKAIASTSKAQGKPGRPSVDSAKPAGGRARNAVTDTADNEAIQVAIPNPAAADAQMAQAMAGSQVLTNGPQEPALAEAGADDLVEHSTRVLDYVDSGSTTNVSIAKGNWNADPTAPEQPVFGGVPAHQSSTPIQGSAPGVLADATASGSADQVAKGAGVPAATVGLKDGTVSKASQRTGFDQPVATVHERAEVSGGARSHVLGDAGNPGTTFRLFGEKGSIWPHTESTMRTEDGFPQSRWTSSGIADGYMHFRTPGWRTMPSTTVVASSTQSAGVVWPTDGGRVLSHSLQNAAVMHESPIGFRGKGIVSAGVAQMPHTPSAIGILRSDLSTISAMAGQGQATLTGASAVLGGYTAVQVPVTASLNAVTQATAEGLRQHVTGNPADGTLASVPTNVAEAASVSEAYNVQANASAASLQGGMTAAGKSNAGTQISPMAQSVAGDELLAATTAMPTTELTNQVPGGDMSPLPGLVSQAGQARPTEQVGQAEHMAGASLANVSELTKQTESDTAPVQSIHQGGSALGSNPRIGFANSSIGPTDAHTIVSAAAVSPQTQVSAVAHQATSSSATQSTPAASGAHQVANSAHAGTRAAVQANAGVLTGNSSTTTQPSLAPSAQIHTARVQATPVAEQYGQSLSGGEQQESSDKAGITTDGSFQMATAGLSQTPRPLADSASVNQAPQLEEGGSVEQWETLAKQVRQAIDHSKNGEVRMRISVKPESLGEVHLDVTMQGQRLKATFVAENESARRLIETGLPYLQRRLEGDGSLLREVALEVSIGSRGVSITANESGGTSMGGRQESASYGFAAFAQAESWNSGLSGGGSGFGTSAQAGGYLADAWGQGQGRNGHPAQQMAEQELAGGGLLFAHQSASAANTNRQHGSRGVDLRA